VLADEDQAEAEGVIYRGGESASQHERLLPECKEQNTKDDDEKNGILCKSNEEILLFVLILLRAFFPPPRVLSSLAGVSSSNAADGCTADGTPERDRRGAASQHGRGCGASASDCD